MNPVEAHDATGRVTPEGVLVEIADMVRQILDEYGLEHADITMGTRFHEDLEMESIDLVALAGLLAERYGEAVNLAEFVAGMDLEELITLSVGHLVDYVVRAVVLAGKA